MKKSEELMLLLDYNKINVTNYRLREQLKFEIDHPNTFLFNLTLEEIALLKYKKNSSEFYLFKNPLMYHNKWPNTINNVEQFYVQTKESNRVVTIDEVVKHPAYNGAGLKRILQDIFAKYIEEYNSAFYRSLDRIKKLYYMVPKNELMHVKNLRNKTVMSVLTFFLVLLIMYLPNQSIIDGKIISDLSSLLTGESNLLKLITISIGRFSLVLMLIYFMIHYAFKSHIKDVEKIEIYHDNFDENEVINKHKNHVDKLMLNVQLYISKIEEEKAQKFNVLKTLHFEQKDLNIFLQNLNKVHKKNDRLQAKKSQYISSLNTVNILANVFALIFIVSLIIQLVLGVMNVV